MEWVIGTLIALIAARAAAVQAWVVWKQHRLDEVERLRKFTLATGVVLASEVGANYIKLRDLLAARKFKESEQETARVMLWVACREKEGWLNDESINEFPSQDLRTIDQLWVQNSNGHFGFSVQKEIYNQVGKDFEKFADQVGWRVGREWKSYKKLMFDMRAPNGHLPQIDWVVRIVGSDYSDGIDGTFLSRRDL